MERSIEQYRTCPQCLAEVCVTLEFHGNRYEMNYYGALVEADDCPHTQLTEWLASDEGEAWGTSECNEWLSERRRDGGR